MAYLDLLILITAPLMVGCVIGAWLTTGRLYMVRMGGANVPVWIPAVTALLASLIGLVVIATQIIATSGGIAASSTTERSAAAIIGLFVNPIWTASASLAVLGLVLHYTLDELLALFKLDATVHEGLALGLRASWALIAFLMLTVSLQRAYSLSLADSLTGGKGAYQLFLHVLTISLTLFCMAAPHLIEQARRRKASDP